MLKLQYFNWDVTDYIARAFQEPPNGSLGMQIFNIDRAKFSGLELAARYENNGFTADIGANYYLDVTYCQDGCEAKSLYGDFATNFVPPEYSVTLDVSQKLFADALTIGARGTYTGPRAIDHGQVTVQGLGAFIALVDWEPYWLVDVYSDYKLDENWTASVRVENLFDQYYVDPLGLVQQPGPGRTFYAGLTGTLGGSEPFFPKLPSFAGVGGPGGGGDWSGFYVGAHVGGGSVDLSGTTTALDGTAGGIPTTESVDQDLDSFLYGGQIGFNHQLANGIVLGVEADWSRTQFGGSQEARATEGTLGDTGQLQAATRYDIDWMSTIRARLGYAVSEDLLIYGTGGLAFAHETQLRDQYRANGASSYDPYGTSTSLFNVEKVSATRTGFTVGFGGEYALNERWSVSAQGTYSYFAKERFKFKNARAGTSRDYTSWQQVGTELVPGLPEQYPDEQEIAEYCANPPPDEERCEPYEEPIWGSVEHQGSSSVVNGREAANSLGAYGLRIGLNYRF